MIPNPITSIDQLPLQKQLTYQAVKREVESKNYEDTLEGALLTLFSQNMIKDANIVNLVKYIAELETGV